MNKMTRVFDEETVSSVGKRRRAENRYYVKSVLKNAAWTKDYQGNNKKQAYLKHLINGCVSPDWVPACNAPARLFLGRKLSKVIRQRYRTEMQPSGISLYHLTLVMPDFMTDDRTPVIDWMLAKKRVAALMRDVCKDFIGVGEVDVTLNCKVESEKGKATSGRPLCPHFHILFWTQRPIRLNLLSDKLASRFGDSPHGIKPVKITRCTDADVDRARMTSYPFKAPSGGKYLSVREELDEDGRLVREKFRLKESGKSSKRNIVFSRLAEVLSYTEINKLIISGGEGVEIKRQLLKLLTVNNGMFADPAPEGFGPEKTEAFWRMMREEGVGEKYKAPKITA